MEKIVRAILLVIVVLLMITFAVLFFSGFFLTGEVIKRYSINTKAICNDSNFCQDYEIICDGEKVVEINPISGAIVQYPDNWQDSRTEEGREKLC